jgi:hypothetical protein
VCADATTRLGDSVSPSATGRLLLFLDAGLELRAPLDRVARIIRDRGVFSVVQARRVGELIHPDTASGLGINFEYVAGLTGCATTAVGFNVDGCV